MTLGSILEDLRLIVGAIHEREQGYSAIGISHVSSSTSVTVNTNEMICGMNTIEHRKAIAEASIELRREWETGKPECIISAIKAGDEIVGNDKTAPQSSEKQ